MTKAEITSVIDALERSPTIVASLVAKALTASLKRRPSPTRWSIHEHAVHLTQVQGMMETRLERMLSEDHPPIAAYFPDKHDDADALLKLDLERALSAFSEDRARLGRRLRALSLDEWQRTADHAEYHNYSVFIMFRHLGLHDFLHAYRIEELVLAK